MAKAAVIGTTTWGTTLALLLAERGHQVWLWARTTDEAQRLDAERQHRRRLPGVMFPAGLRVTASIGEALQGAAAVVIAVPSPSLRENLRRVRDGLTPQRLVLCATKGLERATAKRVSQMLQEELPASLHRWLAVLSGPNLAREIAAGKPASTVVAAYDGKVATAAQELLNSTRFRVYTNTDVVGVELGGALKNIMAIGVGLAEGLEMGDNAKAAFMTRGLAEMARLGRAEGANPLTFAGLAGLGDLVATCGSQLSRNHRLGQSLARGHSLQAALAEINETVEGVDTTAAARLLAQRHGIEMPITETTYRVLFEGLPPRDAVLELLSRAPKAE